VNSSVFFNYIAEAVEDGTLVLDLGCGDGSLLQILHEHRKVTSLGIEISEESVHQCIARGLSVIHGNVDDGLNDFGNQTFDYVILSQTLQVLHHPRVALLDAVRIGRRVVVTLPNFGYWNVRWQLLAKGRMPKTKELPYEWYDTPNIHLVTIRDFEHFCRKEKLRVISKKFKGRHGFLARLLPNLFAESSCYIIATETPVLSEDSVSSAQIGVQK
jgi:methionine biosynthesis protein MetW